MTAISSAFDGKPYIFFSYAHANAHRPMKILTMLQEEGFRVWYDDGLIPGDQYNFVIDSRIKNCSVIIPVISIEYCYSHYCPRELVYARETFAKPVVPIYLDNPTKLEPYYKAGMGMWLSGESGYILQPEADLSELRNKIHDIKILFQCNKAYDIISAMSGRTFGKTSAISSTSREINRSLEDYPPEINESASQRPKYNVVIDSLLLVVKNAIQDGKFEEAETHLGNILLEDPKNADAHFYYLLAKYHVKSTEELAALETPIDSAYVHASSIFQNQERRRILQDALIQNKDNQQYIIASSHMEAGRYQAALNVFNKISDFRDADQKIIECNNIITHNKLLDLYKREIGNGENYLSDRLKEESPEIYTRYAELCRKTSDAISLGFVLSVIVFSILLAGAGILLFVMPDNKVVIGVASFFAICVAVLICMAHVIYGISILTVLLLILYVFRTAFGVILLILALVISAVSIYLWNEYRDNRKKQAEKEKMYKTDIMEFEEAARRDVELRYATLSPKERKELTSIEQNLTRSANR